MIDRPHVLDEAAGVPASPRAPAVSVVVPTYNHHEYIGEALRSAFAQTFRDHEVIVVNDGSPDRTAELLRPLVEGNRIRYFEQENRGQSAARNRGWQEARGRYVAFLDDDDWWPSDKLAWQVSLLDRYPDVVMVYGAFTKVHPHGRHRSDGLPDRPTGSCHRSFLLRNWIDSPGQTLIRADTLRAIGGFDPSIWGSDDWDLYIRLAAAGRFRYEKRVALMYRDHPAGASRHAARHARNHLKVVGKHLGWNVPLVVRHQRQASRYFVPHLLQAAREARQRGAFSAGLHACGYVMLFQPELVFRRHFLALVFGNLLRLAAGRGGEPGGDEKVARR